MAPVLKSAKGKSAALMYYIYVHVALYWHGTVGRST